MAEYLDQCLTTVRADLRPTTIASYRRDVACICSKLSRVRLRGLTPLQIEAAYADLMATGGTTVGRLFSQDGAQRPHRAELTRNVALQESS